MSRREIAADIDNSGGWYSIALMFMMADARRIGSLRARYTSHHDVPYNRLRLFDKCPPSMSNLYKQVILRYAASHNPFTVRMTNPFVRSSKHGNMNSVCIGVVSEDLTRLGRELHHDLASVLAPETQRNRKNPQRRKRHALVLEKEVSQEDGDALVQRIIAEQPSTGLGEVQVSGISLKFNPSDRSMDNKDGPVNNQRIYYFGKPRERDERVGNSAW